MITNNAERSENSRARTTKKNKILKIVTHEHEDNSIESKRQRKKRERQRGVRISSVGIH